VCDRDRTARIISNSAKVGRNLVDEGLSSADGTARGA
jgi:hypothetical protein